MSSVFAGSVHKTLPGRNCVLGSLVDATFMCVVALAPDKAIISTDRGDLCLLDDSAGSQSFTKVASAGFKVTAMAADPRGLVYLGGAQGEVLMLTVSDLLAIRTPPVSPIPPLDTDATSAARRPAYIEALGSLPDCVVMIDSNHSIQLLGQTSEEGILRNNVLQQLPAHGDAVLGVRALSSPNVFGASFFTWSADGTVLFWDHDGLCKGYLQVELEQLEGNVDEINAMKVVGASLGAEYLVSGDKYGVLRYLLMPLILAATLTTVQIY